MIVKSPTACQTARAVEVWADAELPWDIERKKQKKMKRIFHCLVLTLMLLTFTSCAATLQSFSKSDVSIGGKTIGILPFYCTIPSIGIAVSDTIGANLVDSDLRVIERSFLSKIFEDHRLSPFGLKESLDFDRIARVSKADYLLIGNVDAERFASVKWPKYTTRTELVLKIWGATARIVDVSTGEMLVGVSYIPSPYGTEPVRIGEDIARAIKKELRPQQLAYR
jgi:hypothetical protein